LLILGIFIAATFLRLNNVGMTQRREAVIQADKEGATAPVLQGRLYDLQRYVAAHMNANMGTIYLENEFNRAYQAKINSASEGNGSNVFKEAQEVCAPKFASLGHYSLAYQQCVLDQLNSHPSATETTTTALDLPKADTYRYSFVSPLWSPDFAGFSVLVCILIVLIIVARFVGILILRIILKTRNRGI